MIATELAAMMADRFGARMGFHAVHPGFYCAHTETGDEYLDFSVAAAAETDACAILFNTFDKYADAWLAVHAPAKPVLYWRYAAPHIFWHQDDCRLRARLVLVDEAKPIVFWTAADYDAWRRSDIERKVLEALHGQQRQVESLEGRGD